MILVWLFGWLTLCTETAVAMNVMAVAQQALEQSPILIMSQQELESARAKLRAANSSYMPKINAEFSASRGNSSSDRSYSSLVSANTEVRSEYESSLVLNHNIFNGFGDVARIEEVRFGVLLAEANLALNRAEVVYAVQVAFASLWAGNQLREAAQEALSRRDENKKMVELRFRSGQENKGSVLLAQAYTEQAGFDLQKAIKTIELANLELSTAVGKTVVLNDKIKTPQLTDQISVPGDWEAVINALPKVVRQEALVGQARSQLKMARALFWPSLDLRGQLSRRDDHWIPEREGWSVGLSLTVPLFDGLRDYHGVQAGEMKLFSLESQLQSVREQEKLNLQRSYYERQEANLRLKVDKSFLTAAMARAEIARAKYRNGLTTFDAWDLIENDLIQRQKTWVQTQRDVWFAEANWQRLQGKGL